MRVSGIPKKNWDVAYALVKKECMKGKVNEAQVKIIAHTALESLLYEKSPSLKSWKAKQGVSKEAQQALQKTVQSLLVSHKQPWKPSLEDLPGKIQPLVMRLLRGDFGAIKELTQVKGFTGAIICRKNPALLKEMRDMIGKCLIDMHQGIERRKTPLSAQEVFHYEVIIGDLLAVFPFLRPEPGESIEVPVFKEGRTRLVSYKVEPIRLTPNWMGSPLMAYGLNPKKARSSAPPFLLFKGTTYPTDKGHNLSVLTDLNPGGAVGSLGFKHGKKNIEKWLEKSEGKEAIVVGKSLGGALAWRSALYFPDKIKKVMAYAPPGFYPGNLRRLRELNKEGKLPEINIFCQKNDVVSQVDQATSEGVNYYLVLGEKSQKGIDAHASVFSTNEHAAILKLPHYAKMGRGARAALTALRVVFSFLGFPLFFAFHLMQTGVRKLVGKVKQLGKKTTSGNI